MIKKWPLIVVLMLVLIFGYFWLTLGSPFQAIPCKIKGNEWVKAWQEGYIKNICRIVYKDGGKLCSNSNECEGNCIFDGKNWNDKSFICESHPNTDDSIPMTVEEARKP